jgi:hypothetical protein
MEGRAFAVLQFQAAAANAGQHTCIFQFFYCVNHVGLGHGLSNCLSHTVTPQLNRTLLHLKLSGPPQLLHLA